MSRRIIHLVSCTSMAMVVVGAAAAGPVDRFEAGKRALEFDPSLNQHPHSVLVRFAPDATASQRARTRGLVRGELFRAIRGTPDLEQIMVEMDVDMAVAVLSAMPGVVYAEPDFVVRSQVVPNDSAFGSLWGMHNTGQIVGGRTGTPDADIDAPEGWDIFTGDPGFVIAIIDTGTRYTHPDLDGNIWVNPGEVAGNGIDDDGNGYADDVRGWDFYSNDSNPDDTNGHGTHTAGTVGAEGNNGLGVAGVNWRCQLAVLRFLGPNGGYTSDAIEAVNYCQTEGIKVSNNSWGGGGFSQSLFNAINSAKSVGHLFVAAAGNSGTNNDSSPFYPASYTLDNIISVAATGNRDDRASFSNYGATSVDIGAPGLNVYSTYNNSYATLSGTSMAAPHVAGVAAMVYAQNPGWTYAQVRDRIFDTARPVSALSGRCVTGAVVNLADALDDGGSINAPPNVTIGAPANGSSWPMGDPIVFSGSAFDPEDGTLSASIVWTSSLMGQIGVGSVFARADLIAGTHSITATITDLGGLVDTDVVSILVDAGVVVPPTAPSNPTATKLSTGVARIRWSDNSDNESGFQIERQQRVGNQWINTTTIAVPANATEHIDAPGAGWYRWRIRAVNSAGNSSWTPYRAARI